MKKVWEKLKGWKMIIGNVIIMAVVPLIPNPAIAELVKQIGVVVLGVGAVDRVVTNVSK